LEKAIVDRHPLDAWNMHLQDIQQLCSLHFCTITLSIFSNFLQGKIPKEYTLSDPLAFLIPTDISPLLERSLSINALRCVLEHSVSLLEEGVFNVQALDKVRQDLDNQCQEMRKDALVMVESWCIPDFVHQSPLAREDGNIYEAYLELVKKVPGCFGYVGITREARQYGKL
jgi:hypothetical protein